MAWPANRSSPVQRDRESKMSNRATALTRTAAKPTLTAVPAGVLRRQCDCSQHAIAGGECEECKKKRMMLQRWPAGPAEPFAVPPVVHEVLRSPGQPLDAATRAFFEPRFGHDFTNVRLHTDSRAAESAHTCNALAYTVGDDVVFATGQYRPETTKGKHLLAHELTHVVQQQHGGSRVPQHLQISAADEPTEQQADSIADSIIFRTRPISIHPGGSMLRRQGSGPAPTATQPDAGASAGAPVATGSGEGSLCATYGDEHSLSNNPSFCKDTSTSGSLHHGYACYREVPTGSGCPPGKHICFKAGACAPEQTHVDSVAPTMKRDANGFCDVSYLGACSILHGIKDVVKWKRGGIGAGLGALVGGGLGALLGGGAGAAIGAGLGGLAGGVAGQLV